MVALPTFFDGIEERKLGCLPRVMAVGDLLPTLDEKMILTPRDRWEPVSRKHLVWRVHDQNGNGSCNGEAATAAAELWRELAGYKKVPLSAGNLYGRINGGRDQGSRIGDAILALMRRGVCSTNTVPNLDWHQRNWPKGWEKEAAFYKALEAFDCPTFNHIATAVQGEYWVDYGIMVGNNFRPDPQGFIPDYRGGGGGHAMLAIGLVYHNGKWFLETLNSWGWRWGLDGICYVPESYFRGYFNDAWCIRTCVTPSHE